MERDKALDMALGQIEKQFGKGAIMRMGEEAKVRIASIPTGALSLDLALGIGGLPRGRVIEIYGPESSGKCLVAGTYVWSDRGLETIDEVFARVGQPMSCTSRVTDARQADVRLINEEGRLEHLAAVTHNNRRPVHKVDLESGRSVTATANHPLRVLNERGRIVWRTVGRLQEGDVLVSAMFGADDVGSGTLTEDEAVLLGYLVAEGTLGESNRNAIAFTDAHDPDVQREYRELLGSVLGVGPERMRTYAGKEHRVHDAALRARLAEEYGLADVGSALKDIPQRVRTGGAKVQRAFLSALYEGHGWIEVGPEIGLTSASRTLVEQVQLLLLGLGIPASLRAGHDDELGTDHHTVLVPPGAVDRFLEQVGFRSQRRADQVARHRRECGGSTRWEHIPNLAPLLMDLRDALGGDRALDLIIRDVTSEDLTGRPGGDVGCSDARLIKVLDWLDGRHIPRSARPLVAQLHELTARPLTYERITAITPMGEQPTFDVVLPETHSFLANGVLSHNTTVALHAVAEAQKAGGIAAFIDAEHALDPNYAAALGVDVEALLVSQPDTGEQALEITDMLVRSGAVDIVVVDSVAALTPRAEIEGEMGDSHVGLQARLMSQALRKLAGTLHKSKTSAVFINQLREKIGVMFGCMSYETRVTLADGTQEEIGRIVEQRMPVEVLSYDASSGRIEPRKVVSWFDNGRTDEFLHVTVAKGAGDGGSEFAATANHQIRTPGGWREAQDLRPGDRVLQAVPHHLSDFQWEVLLGSLLGDGALAPTRSGHGARFRFGHDEQHLAYTGWKASLFANVRCARTRDADGAVRYEMQPLPELAELREAVCVGGRTNLSHDYLKRLTPLSLAVWYQDAGRFQPRDGSGRAEMSIEALTGGSRRRLVELLRDEWGIEPTLADRAGEATLVFGQEATARLHEVIAPYVHPSMDDTLLPRFRGRFEVEPVFEPMRHELMPMPVLSVERQVPSGEASHRFDIEVDGTHNYFVDGVMVHNSPETTPGGRALKFYSSVRLDVRRIESLKDGTDVVGNRVRVKVVKNKCVAAGTKVFDPTSGLTHAIEDIVDGGAGASVWAADKKGHLHVRPITARMNQGEQEILSLQLEGGGTLRVTPDHRILTEDGWRQAKDLSAGDTVARPRRAGRFGEDRPISPEQARMLGYLIGAGAGGVDGEASITAATAGRPAPEQRIPTEVFSTGIAEDVVANLLFGLFETDGWVAREETGAVRCGFGTASEQLAHQIHWLLLRWGIGSAVRAAGPGSRRSVIHGPADGELPAWEVHVAGGDDVERLAEALPTWGPRGSALAAELADSARRAHRGSPRAYLPATAVPSVLRYLEERGVTAAQAAALVGDETGDPRGGVQQVLGGSRLRRDRVERLADALDSGFLRDVLSEDLCYARIEEVEPAGRAATYDIEVEDLHSFVADDVVVHNCAPPFKQAEFDIMYGHGISKEGSILDIGVDEGIVKKAGAWYTYEGEQLGQGRENAKGFLKEHVEIAEEIYKRVTEQLGLVPTDITGDEPAEDE